MKKAVMYGAGSIGRGFIGQVFHDSGYEVVFLDVAKPIVEALSRDRQYPIRVVSNDGLKETVVNSVRAVDANDTEAAACEIANADIIATAVGVNALPYIAPVIAAGLQKRFELGCSAPLNIIICENLMDAGHIFREMVAGHLSHNVSAIMQNIGFVEASIGRMVPVMTPEMYEGNPLRVWVEPFCELPLDERGFKGDIPLLTHAFTYTPFRFYEERKLYIHNLGHAMSAYLGYLKGYKYIYEAIMDADILLIVCQAMQASAQALAKVYSFSLSVLYTHVDDLIFRFGNKALRDTVERVGQDPLRKLKPADRFIGALDRCKETDAPYDAILKGIAAALNFQRTEDPSANQIQEQITQNGIGKFVKQLGLSAKDADTCVKYYMELRNQF